MNLHLPQSIQAREELRRLAMVATQIVSPQASKPVIGLVQDSLLGIYRMSSEHIRGFAKDKTYYMNPRQFMRLVVWLNNYIGKMPVPLLMNITGATTEAGAHIGMGWTTRQLLSMFLPHISMKSGDLVIRDGKMSEPAAGTAAVAIGKKVVGKSAGGGLFHICWNDLGPAQTSALLDNFSRLISQWLLIDGFSVGLSDLEIERDSMKEIEKIKVDYLADARRLIDGLHLGQYDKTRNAIIKQPRGLAKNDYEQFEVDIMYLLGKCKETIEQLTVSKLTSVHADNRISSMVDSGSKGSSANVVQIIALLGQQDLSGRRIQNSYLRRPVPHVAKDDLSPEARGFCRNSYIVGLNPLEFVFHAMAGRIGVISTSIKTAETGYIQRKLVKVLEDVRVAYGGTVNNASGVVIQYLYSGDGMDGSKIEPQKLDHVSMADDDFMLNYRWAESDLADLEVMLSKEAFARFNANRDKELAALELEWKAVNSDRGQAREMYKFGIPEHIYSPINFSRQIKHTINRLGIKANVPSDLTPRELINEINNAVATLRVSENDRINEVCTTNLRFLIHSHLHSKKLLLTEKITRDALAYLLTIIKVKFNDALVSPGEAIGPIAAQSIGEPSTQMSVIRAEKLIILYNGEIKKVEIGTFIDDLMAADPSNVEHIGNDSYVLKTPGLQIYSINPETDVIAWIPVKSVSKHPVGGNLVKVRTQSGREITTTASHSHLRRTADSIVPIRGDELQLGDRIPVALKLPVQSTPQTEVMHNGKKFNLTENMGWLLGAYTAEGSINGNQICITNISPEYEDNIEKFCNELGCNYRTREYNGEYGPSMSHTIAAGADVAKFVGDSCGRGSFNKHVPLFMHCAPLKVIAAYLRAAIDGDGCISPKMNHEQVRYNSRSKELVEDIALLFNYFGMFATITVQQKENKPFYTASLLRKYLSAYRTHIGSDVKKDKLDAAIVSSKARLMDSRNMTDKLPTNTGLGKLLGYCAKTLCLPDASSTYGRYGRPEPNGRESIGREHLAGAIVAFETALERNPTINLDHEMNLLRRARDSHALWDKITKITVIKEADLKPEDRNVYDLTVPKTTTGTAAESFMISNGIFTHNTLDTFHHTGIGKNANVSRGVPRLKEIMSLNSKTKTPAIVIHLKDSVLRNLKLGDKKLSEIDGELHDEFLKLDLAKKKGDPDDQREKLKTIKEENQKLLVKAIKKIKSQYDYVKFGDIVKKIEIVYDESDESSEIAEDRAFLDVYWKICGRTGGSTTDVRAGSPWVLRFELDKHKLADHNIQLYQIEYIFNTSPSLSGKVSCIFSDDNAQSVICRARIDDVGSNPTAIIETIEQLLMSMKIKGVPLITKTSIRIEKADIRLDSGAIITQYDGSYGDASLSTYFSEKYVIDTVGSNLLAILNMPYVDASRTTSNNIFEVFDIYGIEGARQTIINEIMEVMEYADASVGRRHVELLADVMTSRGILQSVDRFGIKKGETGPWARASFEETTPHMIQAAVFSEVDNMNGVSANVMFGQFIKVGTNSFGVSIDERLVSKIVPEKVEEEDYSVAVTHVADDVAYCEPDNFRFNVAL